MHLTHRTHRSDRTVRSAPHGPDAPDAPDASDVRLAAPRRATNRTTRDAPRDKAGPWAAWNSTGFHSVCRRRRRRLRSCCRSRSTEQSAVEFKHGQVVSAAWARGWPGCSRNAGARSLPSDGSPGPADNTMTTSVCVCLRGVCGMCVCVCVMLWRRPAAPHSLL